MKSQNLIFVFSALKDYEEVRCNEGCELPALICVITGKGPLKQHYCRLIEEKTWKHVHIITPWLEPEDYPRLLGTFHVVLTVFMCCLHKMNT